MRRLRIAEGRSPLVRCHRSHWAAALAVLFVSAAATAVNTNGNGASLNLPTTDLSSAAAQSNTAGARLVSAGTPALGIVSINAGGAKVIIEPMNAIAGNETGPVANFTADPVSGDAPLDVQFADLSSGGLYAILSWSWDFGDGAPTSAEQNPIHTYESPGTYTVTLNLSTTAGSVSKTETDYINVSQGVPALNRAGLFLVVVLLMILGWKAQECPNSRYSRGASCGKRLR